MKKNIAIILLYAFLVTVLYKVIDYTYPEPWVEEWVLSGKSLDDYKKDESNKLN